MDKSKLFIKNLLDMIEKGSFSSTGSAADPEFIKTAIEAVRKNKEELSLDTAIQISESLGISMDEMTGNEAVSETVTLVKQSLKNAEWYNNLSEDQQKEIIFYISKLTDILADK